MHGAHLYLQTVSSKLRALLYQEHTSNVLKLTDIKCFAYPQHNLIERTKLVFKTCARAPQSLSSDLKSGFEQQSFFSTLVLHETMPNQIEEVTTEDSPCVTIQNLICYTASFFLEGETWEVFLRLKSKLLHMWAAEKWSRFLVRQLAWGHWTWWVWFLSWVELCFPRCSPAENHTRCLPKICVQLM